ncbi:MAG: Jag N-terminal domain-containing protein [Clostridia bacterium]|nr:Jag N-terminal domain-containing protein [Clostridia bacterium]
MRECEGIGKNIEQAISNALFELKASREDVDIKIISQGGFLKKARVIVSISEDALEKYEKKESKSNEIDDEDLNDEDFIKSFINTKISLNQISEEPKNEVQEEKVVEEVKEEKVEETVIVEEVKTEEPKKETALDQVEAQDQKPQKPAREYKYIEPVAFLEGLLKVLNIEGTVSVSEDSNFITYKVDGDNLNDLIGHRGECLFALSHLISSNVKRGEKRIILDIGNYREKRKETLENLAHKIANKVANSGRYYKFEPMDPSERKVIHTALQDDDRVTTLSKGVEPHRYLMVFPKNYEE